MSVITMISLAHSREGCAREKNNRVCLSTWEPCMRKRQLNIVLKRMNSAVRGRVLIQAWSLTRSETLGQLNSPSASFHAVKWA